MVQRKIEHGHSSEGLLLRMRLAGAEAESDSVRLDDGEASGVGRQDRTGGVDGAVSSVADCQSGSERETI